jgi:IclR family transcriptional regulator, KDG regulon repressor
VSTSTTIKPPRIQSLARASAIIDVVATADDNGASLSEVSKSTGLNKTTAFNLLASLVTLRFLEQDAQSRHYRLGLRNLELGRLVQQRLHISHLARPILADLCRKTNETVNLGLSDLLDLLVIDSFQGSRILHARANAGWRSMYHCTALGKAFMAAWDEPMRQTIYDSRGLPELTPNTITDADELETQLARFRQQGYATDVEENEIGVNGIARWIVDGLGEVAAAVSVAGHSSRLTPETMERIAPDVIAAADAIGAAISGVESTESRMAKARG